MSIVRSPCPGRKSIAIPAASRRIPIMFRSRRRITFQAESGLVRGEEAMLRKQWAERLLIISGMMSRLRKKVAIEVTASHSATVRKSCVSIKLVPSSRTLP